MTTTHTPTPIRERLDAIADNHGWWTVDRHVPGGLTVQYFVKDDVVVSVVWPVDNPWNATAPVEVRRCQGATTTRVSGLDPFTMRATVVRWLVVRWLEG